MANEENIKLEKMRYRYSNINLTERDFFKAFLKSLCFCYSEEFEAVNNTVELRLHLAPSYRLENGTLQPVTKEQDWGTTLSFDRRKTVGDLRLAIYQVMWYPEALAVTSEQNGGVYFFSFANMNVFE